MSLFTSPHRRLVVIGATLGALLAAIAAAWPLVSKVRTSVYRIGFVASGTSVASAGMLDALRTGLRERGWVEGRNIVIDARFAEGNFDRLPALVAALVANRVDVLVAAPSPAVLAATRATRSIPIVMANVNDPVGLGIVASVARPGGNVTGLSYSFGWEVWTKQLQLLKEALPHARRVAMLSNPDNVGHAHATRALAEASRSVGVMLQPFEARSAAELDSVFAEIASGRPDAVLVVADSLFGSHSDSIAELTTRYRLPSMHGARALVLAGGLIFYGPNLNGQLRQAADYVDRILKGAKPADLPIEQPTKFDLIVNLRTARTLGVTLPPSVLLQADEVIE